MTAVNAPTSEAASDARYDVTGEWGIPDHAAIQGLTAIKNRRCSSRVTTT
jgi:hypothetical protein